MINIRVKWYISNNTYQYFNETLLKYIYFYICKEPHFSRHASYNAVSPIHYTYICKKNKITINAQLFKFYKSRLYFLDIGQGLIQI